MKVSVWDFYKVIFLIQRVTLSWQVTSVLTPLRSSAWNMACLKPKNYGVGRGRAFTHWNHLKELLQPWSAHLHNSCYVRKVTPCMQFCSRVGVAVIFRILWSDLCSPFPMLGQLSWEGQSEKMYSIHKKRIKRSILSPGLQVSCVQNFCATWGWNSVLLKFPQVWFLSGADKKNPGARKINILSMQQISKTY